MGEKKTRILIVDDELDITSVFKRALQEEGEFDVDTFNDSDMALSYFKSDYYDLLLIDIRMPKMNGFDLSKKMKKIDPKPKVCFMTAFEIYFEEFRKVFPNSDVKCFIRKPISPKDLVAQIRAELKHTQNV